MYVSFLFTAYTMLDIHSHILPNVDDGSDSFEESLSMARIAVEDGISAIICTPHTLAGDYVQRRQLCLSIFEEFQKTLKNEQLSLKLMLGAEWRLDADLPDVLEQCTDKHILFDVSPFQSIASVNDFIRLMQHLKKPIIWAHPERHPWFAQTMSGLSDILKHRVTLQLTANSLTGQNGKAIQNIAKAIAKQWPDRIIIASDSHNSEERKPKLADAYKMLDDIASGLAEQARCTLSNLIQE